MKWLIMSIFLMLGFVLTLGNLVEFYIGICLWINMFIYQVVDELNNNRRERNGK